MKRVIPQRVSPRMAALWRKWEEMARPAEERGLAIVLYDARFAAAPLASRAAAPSVDPEVAQQLEQFRQRIAARGSVKRKEAA